MVQIGYRILILGYGEMGHAMHHLLHKHHEIRIWRRRPTPGIAHVDLGQSAAESDYVIFCLPAQPHFDLAYRLGPHLRPDAICVTISKGLDDQCRTPAEALDAALAGRPRAVLYGPMISEEIRAGRPAFAQCGSHAESICTRVAGLYRDTNLHIEAASDVAGLSWSAILKNVYAMAFGVADELGFGDNVRGFLAVTAVHELAAIVVRLGGEPATPYRLAGLGDLITTATSAGSHHHELGRLIVRGAPKGLNGEGVHTLAILRARSRFDTAGFPLFQLIDMCAHEPAATRDRFTAFLAHSFS